MINPLSYWLFRITSVLRWYWGARTRYDVHSPYLTTIINEVIRDRRHFHAFDLIRSVRAYWRRQGGRVQLMSLGAPSTTVRGNERSVSSLVTTNAIDDACGRLLFRLALHLRPRRILEFGTNAGVSTLYLHAADTRTPLQTVEGNPAVAALARRTFARAGTSAALVPYVSLFTEWLDAHGPRPDDGGAPLDLFFCDGDHRYQPTLDYVARLLPHRGENAVFVIADIHWSAGMERAWAELRQLPEVTASLDVYHFGLLFFRPGLDGPHLTYVNTWLKPWRVGFLG